jgi:Tfp pilus assembly protein FimT
MNNLREAWLGPPTAPSKASEFRLSWKSSFQRIRSLMETVMICSPQTQRGTTARNRRHTRSRGFTMIEIVVVIGIAMLLAAMAIPAIQSSLRYMALRSAVSSLTGAIQSTRYQAIFHGCQYQLAFRSATYDYTIATMAPAAGGQACLAAFGAASAAIPLAGNSVALNADVTLHFFPSGAVQADVGALGGIVLTHQSLQAAPETIAVSNYGKITVTP